MIKKFLLVILVVCTGKFSIAQTTAQKLDAYFTAAQLTGIFNGSVLIVQKGETLLKKGYGWKDADAKTMNSEKTIFQIGSVTKQFTATVILKLAEQGKLSLNDKLLKYFPSFPNADKITIENLLTHTSGIWNYTRDNDFMATSVNKPHSEQQMVDLFRNKPLDFEPGTKHSYSNSGYMLLGYIIEKVTGKKYEQVVRQLVFQPLQMVNTGFDFVNLTSPAKATGYQSITENSASKSMLVDSTVSFAAGAIYSTVEDLYKWNQSLPTEKVLKRSSLENAFTPRKDKYGLGWAMDTVQGRRTISHNGGIHGFLSHNSIIPADSVSITLLSNSNSTKLGVVSAAVLAILYDQPYNLPALAKEIKVDTSLLRKYVGEYQLAPSFNITISLIDGALKGQATGQPPFELFAKTENLFFLKVVDAQVEFINDAQGNVESMILHQNGQHIPGKKIK